MIVSFSFAKGFLCRQTLCWFDLRGVFLFANRVLAKLSWLKPLSCLYTSQYSSVSLKCPEGSFRGALKFATLKRENE